MNPMALLSLKTGFEQFKNRHPRFVQFVQTMVQTGLQEGTVLECKVITPDGREIQSNIKVTSEDLELLRQLKDLQENAK